MGINKKPDEGVVVWERKMLRRTYGARRKEGEESMEKGN